MFNQQRNQNSSTPVLKTQANCLLELILYQARFTKQKWRKNLQKTPSTRNYTLTIHYNLKCSLSKNLGQKLTQTYTAKPVYLFYDQFTITVNLFKLKYRELKKRDQKNKIFFTFVYKNFKGIKNSWSGSSYENKIEYTTNNHTVRAQRETYSDLGSYPVNQGPNFHEQRVK